MMLALRPTLWILFRVSNYYRVAGDISRVRPKYWSKRRMALPTTRHSLGPLQVVQEAKEKVSRPIPFEFAVQRFRFAERLLFHRQRGLEMHLGCPEGFVAVPQGDDRAVHALLRKVHGHGVPQAVNRRTLTLQ